MVIANWRWVKSPRSGRGHILHGEAVRSEFLHFLVRWKDTAKGDLRPPSVPASHHDMILPVEIPDGVPDGAGGFHFYPLTHGSLPWAT